MFKMNPNNEIILHERVKIIIPEGSARRGVSLRKMHVLNDFIKSVGRYLGTCSERALTMGDLSPEATSRAIVLTIFATTRFSIDSARFN